MPHSLHPQLQHDGHLLGQLGLSRLLLHRNALVPWFILVPEVEATQLHRMAVEQRRELMDEVAALSTVVEAYFECDRVNVATIGNQVPQLHCHVIARRRDDPCWPGVVWGRLPETGTTWSAQALATLTERLQAELELRPD
jgi:diadenosine tetraphosphate (Ap4A) HIT family hydrolase